MLICFNLLPGEKISDLQTQSKVGKKILGPLRSLNKMRRSLVHDYATDELDDRAKFLRLFNHVIVQLRLFLDDNEMRVVTFIGLERRPPPQLYGGSKNKKRMA